MDDAGGPDITTTPVSPGRGGRPWLAAGLVVAAVAGSFAIARLTPADDHPRPAETTRPTPADGSADLDAVATPLPLSQWFSAPEAPIDDVLVEVGTVRMLRIAGTRLTDEALAKPGLDLLLLAERGGTVCLCWQPSGTESGDPRALDLVRRDDDQGELSRTTVSVVNGLDNDGSPAAPMQVAMEARPDDRFAYLARVVRSRTQWQVSLDVIDLVTASITDSIDLIPIPQRDRSAVAAVERPTLRVAPDGRHALVMSAITRGAAPGRVIASRHAWIVALNGPNVEGVVVADSIAQASTDGSPGEPCDWVAFATATIIAEGCRHPMAVVASLEIRRHDLAGRDLGTVDADPFTSDPGGVLVNERSGIVYAWDPLAHTLFAVDLVLGRSWSAGPVPGERENPAAVLVAGVRPPPGAPTTWSDGGSATAAAPRRVLAGSSDGSLLYAIGDSPHGSGSSGIWVFDARTLTLVERWPAHAAYASLTLFEDGRWLAAAGRPGLTASGDPADWQASVTIHDTETGRPVLRLGDIGTSEPVTFPRSVTLVATP